MATGPDRTAAPAGPGPGAPRPQLAPPDDTDLLFREARRRRRRRRLTVGAVVLLAALVATGVALAAGPGGGPAPGRRGLAGAGPGARASSGGSERARPGGALGAPAVRLQRLAFFDPTHGYGLFEEQRGAVCEDLVGRTDDGGSRFGPLAPVTPCASSVVVSQLAFDDHGDGFAYGPGLYVTHDGGRTWADDPQHGTVVAVAALGSSVWMVEGACLPASAAGTTPTCPLLVEESSDGGRTWSLSPTPPPGAMASVGALSNEPALGQSWLVRLSPSSAYVISGPVATDTVPLWYTSDGGRTWTSEEIPCGVPALSALLSVAPDGTLVAVCAGQPGAGSQLKSLAVSSDAGRTWSLRNPCPGEQAACINEDPLDFGSLTAVDATSATTVYVAGARSPLVVTRDGGTTWARVDSVGNVVGGPTQVLFFDPSHGVVLGQEDTPAASSAIWHTSDGGVHWPVVIPRATSALRLPGGPVVLGPDGLGVAPVGAPAGQATAALTRQLGRPTGRAPGVCPGTTEVRWHGLSVELAHGRFTGYRVERSPGGPVLATATGATLGMPLVEVRALYPPAAFSMEQNGAVVVPGLLTGDRLFLGFYSPRPAATLQEIKGGSPCGDV